MIPMVFCVPEIASTWEIDRPGTSFGSESPLGAGAKLDSRGRSKGFACNEGIFKRVIIQCCDLGNVEIWKLRIFALEGIEESFPVIIEIITWSQHIMYVIEIHLCSRVIRMKQRSHKVHGREGVKSLALKFSIRHFHHMPRVDQIWNYLGAVLQLVLIIDWDLNNNSYLIGGGESFKEGQHTFKFL